VKTAKTMNIKQILPLGFGVIILIVSLSSLITLNSTSTLKESSDWVAHTYQVQSMLRGLEKSLVDAETGQRGFIITGEDEFLEPYNQTEQNLDDDFDQLSDEISDNPEQLERLAKLEELAQEKLAELQQTINLKKAGQDEIVLNIVLSSQGKQIMDNIRIKLAEMIAVESDLLSQRQERTQLDYQLVNLVSWIGLITIFIVGLLVLLLINKLAIQPINTVANTIAISAHEIATAIEQQERTALGQAASVNTTTTTMDELEASSRQSAEQADAASDQAQLALQAAENGNRTVSQTLEGMDQVTQSVKEIADKITRLSERTNQIGNISLIVSNLASQTNMLALNAAVEAVRAGEQGRGFSIVASEIQKLADKSKKSTEEINTLVDEIQNSIRSTVMAADEGKKTVNWSMSMTQNTTQAFVGITDTINTVVMYNQQISLNVQQEVIAIKQVVEAMESINQGAKETALGIRQTRIGTENLKQVAEQLKTIV